MGALHVKFWQCLLILNLNSCECILRIFPGSEIQLQQKRTDIQVRSIKNSCIWLPFHLSCMQDNTPFFPDCVVIVHMLCSDPQWEVLKSKDWLFGFLSPGPGLGSDTLWGLNQRELEIFLPNSAETGISQKGITEDLKKWNFPEDKKISLFV